MLRKIFLILFISIIFSCKTSQFGYNYNRFETFRAKDYSYYYLNNTETKNLIIYIDGSGLSSVLGISNGNKFSSYSFAYPISKNFCGTNSILIPEKPGMLFGGVYHSQPEVIRLYTVNNLVESYAKSIDHRLSSQAYKNVCIVGVSEGGLLTPMIYSVLKNKPKINELIIIGAGGLSQYDCFRIQYENYPELSKAYREQLSVLEEIREEIRRNPDSIEKGYLGWPFSRWSSFFNYEPLEYIKKITIPMLYIVGKEDENSPIESVEIIEELGLSNISFEYLDNMGHLPKNDKQMNKLFNLIEHWRYEN